MRGQKSILETRLQNIPVNEVWVYVVDFEPLEAHRVYLDPEKLIELELLPEVFIYPSDVIQRLDFRFLVGTTVHLSGDNVERVKAAQRRIKLFRPHMMLTTAGEYFDIHQYLEAA
jgi:hypothetical protein